MKVYMCTTKNVLYMYIYLVTLVKSACKVEDEDLLSIPRSKNFFFVRYNQHHMEDLHSVFDGTGGSSSARLLIDREENRQAMRSVVMYRRRIIGTNGTGQSRCVLSLCLGVGRKIRTCKGGGGGFGHLHC